MWGGWFDEAHAGRGMNTDLCCPAPLSFEFFLKLETQETRCPMQNAQPTSMGFNLCACVQCAAVCSSGEG